MQEIHLIGYGKVPAIPASEVKPGMRIVYNYGYRGEVLRVAPAGPNSIELTVKMERDPLVKNGDARTYTQKKRRSTLVAAYFPKASLQAAG